MNTSREIILNLLRTMMERNASDLHIGAMVKPYFRINGEMICTDFPPMSVEETNELIFSLLSEERRQYFLENKTLDFSFAEKDLGRFRTNIYQQRGTVAAAIRRLPMEVPSIEALGLPADIIKAFCNLSHGLVLVCGPTGSGKTTTLASMINYINQTRSCHIISIEDPIEYTHRNIKSLIHQREIGRDTPNFYDALKYMLREDPDIVVIGEMRDLETISAALTIAETGHLVLATLHTGETSESIRRIVDSFPAAQQLQIISQLACTLVGVVNQMLIPREDEVGRLLASEVMMVTPAIQNLIRENKIEQIYSHLQMGSNFGMYTMAQSLYELINSGQVTREMALGKTKRTKELIKLLEACNA